MTPDNNEFSDSWAEVPESTTPYTKLNEPNQELKIYEGVFLVKEEELEFEIDGIITFNWFPVSRARFVGLVLKKGIPINRMRNQIDLFVKDNIIGSGRIMLRYSNRTEERIEGYCNGVILGDNTVPVSEVAFVIPNLRDLKGECIKTTTDTGIYGINGRIQLTTQDYIVTIDKLYNFQDLQDLLTSKGGYIITYSGNIKSTMRAMYPSEINRFAYSLSQFLYFINGRRASSALVRVPTNQ